MLQDKLGRPIHDLRISVTDRCNFRCGYCMPKAIFGAGYQFMKRDELLSFEELVRAAQLFTDLGVVKVRITGGEPLIRQKIEVLIAMLAQINSIRDISMTTNASLLTLDKARSLKEAGLNRITVSLDALDNDVFKQMNDVDFPVAKVLAGIDCARQVGFKPIKVNMVVRKDINEDQVLPMARYFRSPDYILRFIEYMDVGHSNQWQPQQVVAASRLVEKINRQFPIETVTANYQGEVAERWRYLDGQGEIGFIASITQPFCRDCSRVRLSAEGKLYTCLFATGGYDLRSLLRNDHSDDTIKQKLSELWQQRTDRYSELRATQTVPLQKIEMSYIGG